ncbi:SET domain-containing protein-lysine N-methyltransferase [Candidatus Woesearchaeota archaeon]|nr:SET domain-containing protein-lysine N-methyltransferase [Candidatus Woesearchaeota archaeon]
MTNVEVRQSSIHNKGLFALLPLRKGERIIEYTGEKISKKEGDRRSDEQEASGKPMVIFELDDKWDLDASVGGSGAEYANHSCNPNVESVDAEGKIFLIALRDIKAGEELTYDYNFDAEAEHTPCHCGSPQCRGKINRPE